MDESVTGIVFPAHQSIEDILPRTDITDFPRARRVVLRQLQAKLHLQRAEMQEYLKDRFDYLVPDRQKRNDQWLYVFPNKPETRTPNFWTDVLYRKYSFGFAHFSTLDETIRKSKGYMQDPAVITAVNIQTGDASEYFLRNGQIIGPSPAEFSMVFGEDK